MDTTAHMVKHWTNQLMASAQMEQTVYYPEQQVSIQGSIKEIIWSWL